MNAQVHRPVPYHKGHRQEWRVIVTTCKRDKKAGNHDYSVICSMKDIAREWAQDVKEDCISTRGKCRSKLEKLTEDA